MTGYPAHSTHDTQDRAPPADAANGEIVVALIDGEAATLKRLYREAHHLRLQPANAEMAPLRLAPETVELIGVVVAVLREGGR